MPARSAVALVFLVVVVASACSNEANLPVTGPAAPASPTTTAAKPQATQPQATKPQATQPFLAFVPGRHEQLHVVDAATGRVDRSYRAPSSIGFTGSLSRRVAYFPVPIHSCRVRIDRLPLTATRLRHRWRSVAVLRGGFVDDVDAQPSLSPNGRLLAVTVASGPAQGVGGSRCAGTDRLAIVHLRTGQARYFTGSHGDQLDDLAWDGGRVVFRVTPFPYRGESTVRTISPRQPATTWATAPRLLVEHRGRLGPVFVWRHHLAVVRGGSIERVKAGHVVPVSTAEVPVGLPPVERVSVADNGIDLLFQSGHGTTYWWNGHTTRKVPGGLVEPIW